MSAECPRCGLVGRAGSMKVHVIHCFTSPQEFVMTHGHRMTIDSSGCVFLLRPDGSVQKGALKNGTSITRVVLEAKLGRKLLPAPQEVACHTCDVPWCVNWWHLWAGTQSENLLDAYRKGRRKKVADWRVQLGVHSVL